MHGLISGGDFRQWVHTHAMVRPLGQWHAVGMKDKISLSLKAHRLRRLVRRKARLNLVINSLLAYAALIKPSD